VVINHSNQAGQVRIRPRSIGGTLQADLPPITLKSNGYFSRDDFYQWAGLQNVFGPIEIEAEGGIQVTATARIYTRQGTSGYFQGVDANLAAQEVILPYTVESLDFRTNLGITNPGEETATGTVSLIGKKGTLLGSLPYSVPAHGMTQINSINQTLAGQGAEGYLRLNFDKPVIGWTSQIDNLSQDLSMMVGKTTTGGHSRLLIPSTVSTGKFTSTLAVVNLGTTATTVELTARGLGGDVNGSALQLTIPAQGMIASSDILAPLALPGTFGPLEIQSLDGKPLLAVSRVYSPNRTAGYFEGIPIEP
jgi:hypothetical protein